MNNCTELNECLACGRTDLKLELNLGKQPLANNFLAEPGKNETYPLAVNRCQTCYHLQLTHVVDPGIIYRDYAYVSGTSQTYLDYMKWFAKWAREYSDRWRGHVLDIGCNDGSQLDAFADLGFNTHGVDPAENLYATSTQKGHNVVCGFWDKKSVKQLENDRFDIVVAQNAFAHNPDPVQYLKLLAPLMKEKGLFFIQTSQADMVRNGEFDTVYHEHVNFYNINSMYGLAQRAGMYLVDAVKTPIHGTSYVFVLSTSNLKPKHVKNLLAMESDLLTPGIYTRWANVAESIKNNFADTCNEYKKLGYRLVGYGAAAKGMTLLNYAQVDLDVIIDDNPLKQGTYSPGRDIPIVSSEYLGELTKTDHVLFVPLAWNVYAEIKEKILAVRKHNDDRFLRYFPEVTVED
jgi:2-polyprenyl-3-methyl-5-hydroxy-6-metoxy-1,4-benzoquinol methylase